MNKSCIDVIQGPTLRGRIMTVVGVIPAETLVRHHAVPKGMSCGGLAISELRLSSA